MTETTADNRGPRPGDVYRDPATGLTCEVMDKAEVRVATGEGLEGGEIAVVVRWLDGDVDDDEAPMAGDVWVRRLSEFGLERSYRPTVAAEAEPGLGLSGFFVSDRTAAPFLGSDGDFVRAVRGMAREIDRLRALRAVDGDPGDRAERDRVVELAREVSLMGVRVPGPDEGRESAVPYDLMARLDTALAALGLAGPKVVDTFGPSSMSNGFAPSDVGSYSLRGNGDGSTSVVRLDTDAGASEPGLPFILSGLCGNTRVTTDAVEAAVERHPRFAAEIREFADNWHGMLPGEGPDSSVVSEMAREAFAAHSVATNAEREDGRRIVHWGEADARRHYDDMLKMPLSGPSFRRTWEAVGRAMAIHADQLGACVRPPASGTTGAEAP